MVRDPLPVVLWSEIDRMVGAEGVIGERPVAWVDKASRLSTLSMGCYGCWGISLQTWLQKGSMEAEASSWRRR